MSDYIKREYVIETVYKLREHFKCWDRNDDITIKNALNAIPPADVRENVRGEWLPHPIKGYREWDVCSACGKGCKRREYGIHANGEKWVTEENFPFCPNCGADMNRRKL